MPKPYLLKRPSGVFVRFFVPSDLHARVGSRYVVRRLPLPMGDAARLVAAQMAVALSGLFETVRQSAMTPDDADQLLRSGLRALHTGKAKDYTITQTAHGLIVQADGPEDHGLAMEMVKEMKDGRVAPPPPPSPPPAPLLSVLVTNYLTDLRNAGLSEGNILDSRTTLTLFVDLVGDRPVDQVTDAHLRTFMTDMQDWPTNARKLPVFRDLDARAIIAKARQMKANGTDVDCIAARTKAKHRDRLATFLNMQVNAGVLTRSPLNGIKRHTATALQAEEEARRPFTSDELANIFYAGNIQPWSQDKPHRFWGAWLGYYTGARVNEVAQLYARDVYSINGIWGVHFRTAKADQKQKNPNSNRFVPLHPALIDGGFLDYVKDVQEAKHERLFPLLPWSKKAGYGDALGDQFSAYMDRVGITEKGVAFHAFRHTLANALIGKSVDQIVVASITGHLPQLPGALGTYVKPAELAERARAINLLTCPHTITPYQAGDGMDGLRKAHHKIRRRQAQREARAKAQRRGG